MGEYAISRRTGHEIKLGTCETMYYIRYSQKNEVKYDFGKYAYFWRLPFPEEDGIPAGSYETYEPWKNTSRAFLDERYFEMKKKLYDQEPEAGFVQLRSDALGMLVNVSCYHGTRLPESTKDTKFFFNGKRNPLRIAYVKNYPTEMRVVYACAACGKMWSASYNEIAPYIMDDEMRDRLYDLCTEYWNEHNSGLCPYVRLSSEECAELIERDLNGRSDAE